MPQIISFLLIFALFILDTIVRESTSNKLHAIIWEHHRKWIVWTKSILILSGLLFIIDLLLFIIHVNTISTIAILVFVSIFVLYVTYAIIVFRNVMSLRPLISSSILIMSVILIVYLFIGANDIFSKNNVSYLLILMLCYLPSLTIPFVLGAHRAVTDIVKDHEKVFKGQNLLMIYGSLILTFISIFSIMATFASLVTSHSNTIVDVYVYFIIYFLAPISLIAMIERAQTNLLQDVENYGLSCKITKILQLLK